MVLNFCQFPLKLSCSNITCNEKIWAICNSSDLKRYYQWVFFLYNNFKLTWSATDWRLVADESGTGRQSVATSHKEVPTRSPTSRRSVGNQSPISRRRVADQLQNLVATPLRSLWILVAERSQSGCSVCLTGA